MNELEYGLLGSAISFYLSFLKMGLDFFIKGRDSFFSRALIPFYNSWQSKE